MSRSYKKNNVVSVTKCGEKLGEKDDKQRCNRSIRRNQKILEKEITKDPEVSEEKNFCLKNELGNTDVWKFRKDGKQFVDKDCPDTSIHWTSDKKHIIK